MPPSAHPMAKPTLPRSRSRLPQALVWGALAVLSGLLVACSKPAPAPEPVRAVRVVKVGEGSLDMGAQYAGELRARVESRLGFRVGGKLIKRHVENGQHVKAGQLLAELDPTDYRLAGDVAQAQVNAALTNRDLAKADLQRFKDLRDQNFISGAEFERRETTLKAAQAQLDQAQAQLNNQRNQSAYTRLLADVAGVVTAIDAEVGQVVSAGTSVVRVAQDGARDVVFTLPEDRLATVNVGDVMTVQRWGSADTLTGKVREISGSADPVSRTFTVKLALASGDIPLGATVTVVPQRVSRHGLAQAIPVLKLPTSALRQEVGQTMVWRVEPSSMTVQAQVVEVETADGNMAIIKSGLKPSDVVVSAGVHVLSPGQKVSYYVDKNSPAPAALSAPNLPAPTAKPAVAN